LLDLIIISNKITYMK